MCSFGNCTFNSHEVYIKRERERERNRDTCMCNIISVVSSYNPII